MPPVNKDSTCSPSPQNRSTSACMRTITSRSSRTAEVCTRALSSRAVCGWSSRSRKATRLPSLISQKVKPFAAMARSSVVPRRRPPEAVGSRNRWFRCPTRRRSTICRGLTATRSGCRHWKATPSKAIAMPTVRSAPATSSRSRPACNASPARSSSRWTGFARNCCRNIPTSTTWWRSRMPMAVASQSTRRAPPSRSARCRTLPAIPILVAR